MGGGSKKPANDGTQAGPTPAQPATMTMPAFAPGMQSALAEQLAAGYGQQPADLMSYLSNIYKPMTFTDYSQGFVPPAGPVGGQTGGSQPASPPVRGKTTKDRVYRYDPRS